MKSYKFRSICNIRDHIPCKRNPIYNYYDNKLLSKFAPDDFAGFVLDHLDAKNNPTWDKKHFLYQIEMLDCIPNKYARVYLYGVWSIVKSLLLTNIKIKKDEKTNRNA